MYNPFLIQLLSPDYSNNLSLKVEIRDNKITLNGIEVSRETLANMGAMLTAIAVDAPVELVPIAVKGFGTGKISCGVTKEILSRAWSDQYKHTSLIQFQPVPPTWEVKCEVCKLNSDTKRASVEMYTVSAMTENRARELASLYWNQRGYSSRILGIERK